MYNNIHVLVHIYVCTDILLGVLALPLYAILVAQRLSQVMKSPDTTSPRVTHTHTAEEEHKVCTKFKSNKNKRRSRKIKQY